MHNKILNEIFHHSDYVRHWFDKYKITDKEQYLNNLINRVDIVNSYYAEEVYTIEGKHYMADHQIVEGTFVGINFWYDGKEKGKSDYYLYKKYYDNSLHKKIRIIIAKYLKSKLDVKYLNKLLKESKLPDFVVVGVLLSLRHILK